MVKKILMVASIVLFGQNVIANNSNETNCTMSGIFGIPTNVLSVAMLAKEYFEKNNTSSWYPWKYAINGITVHNLDDYIFARSRILANVTIIEGLQNSIYSKLLTLAATSPLKPELGKLLLGECEKISSIDDYTKFINCIETAERMHLDSIKQTYNDLKDQAEQKHKYKMETTADAHNIEKYENTNIQYKSDLHKVAELHQKNIEESKKTGNMPDFPEMFELAKRMAQNNTAKNESK